MSKYRTQPTLNKNAMSVNPRNVPIRNNFTFSAPVAPMPTQEEIQLQHKQKMNQIELEGKLTGYIDNSNRQKQQFNDKREQNFFSFMQNQIAKQEQARQKQQPKWGGNQLSSVTRQPNYGRVDYLEPVKMRKV